MSLALNERLSSGKFIRLYDDVRMGPLQEMHDQIALHAGILDSVWQTHKDDPTEVDAGDLHVKENGTIILSHDSVSLRIDPDTRARQITVEVFRQRFPNRRVIDRV